jgi:hypothetical protein
MPLHEEEQPTFQIVFPSAANSAERTSRSPCGPVTHDGAAAADELLPAEVLLAVLLAAEVPGVPEVSRYCSPPVSTEEVPSGANTYTSYVPATSAGVVNTTRVADTVETGAEAVSPIRTRAPDGTAVPVMVT